MSYYDGKLMELQQKVARKKKLESILQELKQQRGELTDKVNLLKQTKLKEEADVDKLQGKSLAAIFYTIFGKKEEKLDKEKQEAYAAVVKYKVAVQEMETIESEIRQYEAELMELKNCFHHQNHEPDCCLALMLTELSAYLKKKMCPSVFQYRFFCLRIIRKPLD